MPVCENDLKRWLHTIQLAWRADQCVSYATNLLRKQDLLSFIQELKITIQGIGDLGSVVKTLPSVGQVLGHIAWVPAFFVCKELATSVLHCLLALTVTHPTSSIEQRSTNWAWQQISRLLKLPKTVKQVHDETKGQGPKSLPTFFGNGLILCQEIGFSYQCYLMESKSAFFKLTSDYVQAHALNNSDTKSCTVFKKLQEAAIPLLYSSFVNDVVKSLTDLGNKCSCDQQFDQMLALAFTSCIENVSPSNQIAIYEYFPELFQEHIVEWMFVNNTKMIEDSSGYKTAEELKACSWFKCCLFSPNLLLVLWKCMQTVACHPKLQGGVGLKLVDLVLFSLEASNIKDVCYIH